METDRVEISRVKIYVELFLEAPSFEEKIQRAINRLIFSIKDTDLKSFTCSLNCRGGCIRRIIVKHLQLLEFDASFEKAQVRQSSDIDFRSQFEIARPTQSYIDLIACLPVILVGSAEKLSHVLSILADEAKLSLKNNKMYVSPWRSLSYMRCEWLYPLCTTLSIWPHEDCIIPPLQLEMRTMSFLHYNLTRERFLPASFMESSRGIDHLLR
ncbi:hypothetical protein KP509_01G086500 [Ceratopteris richardii]|uniref:Uncharacterized protein n=1 Tax=Ceratopteris richardii TaxID=49495 RepID=A0A8T2VN85_CERRI|nr:hypothetical protein KP509_01G086500 [Ceratopteris richardii]